MAQIRFPAGTALGAERVGGQFAAGPGVRSARYVGPNGSVVSLTSRFPGIIAGVQLRCRVASREAAENILEDARSRAPSLSGALRESLYIVDLDITEDWAIASDLEYAPYVEFGSIHNVPPQPYLIPALEAERGPYIRRTAAALVGL